jgi:hypothetical protein
LLTELLNSISNSWFNAFERFSSISLPANSFRSFYTSGLLSSHACEFDLLVLFRERL